MAEFYSFCDKPFKGCSFLLNGVFASESNVRQTVNDFDVCHYQVDHGHAAVSIAWPGEGGNRMDVGCHGLQLNEVGSGDRKTAR